MIDTVSLKPADPGNLFFGITGARGLFCLLIVIWKTRKFAEIWSGKYRMYFFSKVKKKFFFRRIRNRRTKWGRVIICFGAINPPEPKNGLDASGWEKRCKEPGFVEELPFFSIFHENNKVSDQTIFSENYRLIKGYNQAEFQKKYFFLRFRPYAILSSNPVFEN